jgi:hypothetical protein
MFDVAGKNGKSLIRRMMSGGVECPDGVGL